MSILESAQSLETFPGFIACSDPFLEGIRLSCWWSLPSLLSQRKVLLGAEKGGWPQGTLPLNRLLHHWTRHESAMLLFCPGDCTLQRHTLSSTAKGSGGSLNKEIETSTPLSGVPQGEVN